MLLKRKDRTERKEKKRLKKELKERNIKINMTNFRRQLKTDQRRNIFLSELTNILIDPC